MPFSPYLDSQRTGDIFRVQRQLPKFAYVCRLNASRKFWYHRNPCPAVNLFHACNNVCLKYRHKQPESGRQSETTACHSTGHCKRFSLLCEPLGTICLKDFHRERKRIVVSVIFSKFLYRINYSKFILLGILAAKDGIIYVFDFFFFFFFCKIEISNFDTLSRNLLLSKLSFCFVLEWKNNKLYYSVVAPWRYFSMWIYKW